MRLVALMLIFGGCGLSGEPGTFEVRFQLEGGELARIDNYYAFARVEKRVADRTLVLSQAIPARLGEQARLQVDDVPNGSDYYVAAELRPTKDGSTFAEYFGRSQPFSLRAGQHQIVDVELKLQRTPSESDDGPAIRVQEASDDRYVRDRAVSLVLKPKDATHVRVSNDPNRLGSGEKRPLSELERHGAEYVWPDWNLDLDLCLLETCPDGRREVHAQFYNEAGYGSLVYSTEVMLDQQTPALSHYELSGMTAADGDRVALLIVADEALQVPPELSVSPPDFQLEPTEAQGESPFSYTFAYVVDQRAVDGQTYELTARLSDLAGNTREVELPDASFTITGALAVRSTRLERAPSFRPFERASFYNRSDPVSGEPVTALVRIETNMPYGAGPQLIAQHPDGHTITLELDAAASDEDVAVFHHTFGKDEPAGSYQLQLDWRDAHGRLGNPDVHTQLVLVDAPAESAWGAVDTGIDAQGEPHTLYTSRPWGVHTRDGYRVLGDSLRGSVIQRAERPEDCIAQVLVYGDIEASGLPRAAALLGAADVACSKNAQFQLDFNTRSGPKIYTVPVTASGYPGPPQRVEHGEWVATLPDATQGGTVQNPHDLRVLPEPPRTATEQSEPGALPARSTDTAISASWKDTGLTTVGPRTSEVIDVTYDPNHGRAFAVTRDALADHLCVWQLIGSEWTVLQRGGIAPLPYFGSRLIYDSARGRLVLYGGGHNETWEWDDREWTHLTPQHSPPENALGPLAYDAARQKVVFVTCDATWEWDGSDWSERERLETDGACVDQLVFDSERERTVAFVADDGHTLTFERSLGAWQRIDAEHTPPADGVLQMTYDAARKRTVLTVTGPTPGEGAPTTDVRSTWAWDGRDWSLLERAEVQKGASWQLYEAATETLLRLSGSPVLSAVDRLDMDDSTWTSVERQNHPPPLARHAMTYDSARHQLAVFGGTSNNIYNNEVWEYDGSSWLGRDLRVKESPGAYYKLPMVYDAARSVSVLPSPVFRFGAEGVAEAGSTEIFTFDGNTWQQRAAEVSPPARAEYGLANDLARQQLVMFGGAGSQYNSPCVADTWTYDWTQWTQHTSEVSPSARKKHALTYDRKRERVVLFGGAGSSTTGACDNFGTDLADVWEWDGQRWEARTPSVSPPARSGHALAYDEARERVVLFGGSRGFASEALSDTWEWDGTTWTQVFPLHAPGARANHEMVYDSDLGKLVLFGGSAGTDVQLDDLWAFNGNDWMQVPLNSQAPTWMTQLIYDQARERVVTFENPQALTQTKPRIWEWNGSRWSLVRAQGQQYPAGTLNMIFDAQRGSMLALEQGLNASAPVNTWTWDGSSWLQIDTGTFAAPQRAIMHEAALGTNLLVTTDSTYRMEGDAWRAIPSVGGVGEGQLVEDLVYDPVSERGLMLVRSRDEGRHQLWQWDGMRWSSEEMDPGTTLLGVDPREGGLIFTQELESVDAALWFSGLYLLDGAGMRELPTARAPRATIGAVACDEQRDQLVVRGHDGNTYHTYILSKAQPTHQLDFDLTTLVGTGRTREVVLDGFALRANTGADGGVALAGWSGLGFRDLHAHDARFDAPGELCFESSHLGVLSGLEVDRTLHFTLRPRATGGGWLERPRLRTDGFELRVRYHFGGAEAALPPEAARGHACAETGWSAQDWQGR